MGLTIILPEDLERQIRQLPDPAGFVADAVRQALDRVPRQVQPKRSEESRWARMVRRIEEDPVSLDGYGEQLKKDIREFRDNFQFYHDR